MNNYQIQPQMQPVRSFGPSMQPYLPQPDHRKRNLIIVLSVITAVTVLAAILWFSYTHSASYRIRKGFMRLAKESQALKNPMEEKLGTEALCRMFFTEGSQMDTKLNVTFDSYFGEVTLGMDTAYAKDRRNKEMSASTAVSIMNYELGHMDIYADRDNVCFSIPELFLEDMYLENKNVLAQYNSSMWADDWWFGEAQGDDFTIDLFSQPWFFTDEDGVGKAFLNRYDLELKLCRQSMEFERAGDDVYRISVDSFYANSLVWQMLIDWLDDNLDSSMVLRKDILGLSNYFTGAGDHEKLSILVELNRENRIESIRLEEPISLGRGSVRIDGDIYFLGGENSLEKMQGRITFDNKNSETYREHEIIWQVVRSLEQGDYRMESEAKHSFLKDGKKETEKFGWDFSYDAPKNSFETKADVKFQGSEIALEASGDFSHIKRGEGFDLDLDEVNLLIDGEETLKIRGEIDIAPLSRDVKKIAKPETAFFAMDGEDWGRILDKIDREYGYLWEAAMEYLW